MKEIPLCKYDKYGKYGIIPYGKHGKYGNYAIIPYGKYGKYGIMEEWTKGHKSHMVSMVSMA